MIPQVCYTLASDETDRYAEMAFVSASLLRRLYPEARVVLLVGSITDRSLRERRAPVRDVADQIIVLPIAQDEPARRSRWLKTQIRQVLTGPFLYLDVDALPIRRFDEVFETVEDLAAVHDYPPYVRERRFPSWAIPDFAALGWKYPLSPYYNAGVVYWSDSPRAHQAGREWHERYVAFRDRCGKNRDQPAFNSAVDAVGAIVRILPVKYNAMFRASPWFARGARILHFFTDGGVPEPRTLLGHLVDVWVREKRIDWAVVDRASRRSDPWVGQGRDLDFEACMATGRYVEASRRIPKFLRRKTRELLGRPARLR